MNHFDNMILVCAIVDKSVSEDVAKEVADISPFHVVTFYGTMESNETGLLGVRLRDEVDMIVCFVNELCVERTIEVMSSVGMIDELGRGYCFTLPLQSAFVPQPIVRKEESE